MVKPGLGLFTGRRKSSSNVLEEIGHVETVPSPDAAHADSGGFRLMSRTEVEKANERRKTLEREKSSKFRFSGFGANGKGRVQSFEEESPGSSKRDSKSSSGTQFSASRPYNNGQHGSTSTLPSSTDASSDDNIFSTAPRPPIPQHNSSPSASLSMNGFRKQLPSLPKSSHALSSKKEDKQQRERSMTASSYASTAIPPKLDAGLDFGNSTFDDMFSDINRKESPPVMSREAPGRSLLSEKRTFQPEPIKTYPKLDVEAPLKSWESRGSAENLMSSSHSDDGSPPPPPPPHKYSSYAPVASESPTLPSHATFGDRDAHPGRQSYMDKPSYRDSSPEQHPTQPTSLASSSANSLQTPASSRSSNYTNNTTPKASLGTNITTYTDNDDDENLFAPVKAAPKSESRAAQKAPAHSIPEDATPTAPANPARPGAGRVLTQTEYLAMQKRANSQPPPEDDSDEDYEDEEEAIKKREEEEIKRRKQQQMQFAREAMRRTTTTSANPSRPDGGAEDMMGFPSETSIKADEWEDEDVPLGILAQHGFPSQVRGRMPNQPANAMPSYIPDRPASAGAVPNRASGHLPAFARGLPADPHSSFIGGGLVQPMNRESMGFNGFSRGPMSVAGDSMAGGMGMHSQMMYQDAGMSQPSLVDQIQMRDMTKQKYMGGASQKKPEGGPFTGMLGQQMNASGQLQHPTRMSQMPTMGGMMNPMMGGQMGGQMPMMGMGMGMNQMGYSMPQGNDMMAMQQMQQMQQMIAMQQMQLQQMQAMQRPQTQDPRMSMVMPNNFGGNMMGNGSFLNVPGAMPNGMQNRPMSFMSGAQGQQPPMPNYMGPGQGYTPSIAPSERSNVGLSARYRPVVNNSDAHSTGTSTILQASSGASANKPNTIKGIIKPARPPPVEEDEDWSKMAARKSKFGFGSKKSQSNGLEELTKGLNL